MGFGTAKEARHVNSLLVLKKRTTDFTFPTPYYSKENSPTAKQTTANQNYFKNLRTLEERTNKQNSYLLQSPNVIYLFGHIVLDKKLLVTCSDLTCLKKVGSVYIGYGSTGYSQHFDRRYLTELKHPFDRKEDACCCDKAAKKPYFNSISNKSRLELNVRQNGTIHEI